MPWDRSWSSLCIWLGSKKSWFAFGPLQEADWKLRHVHSKLFNKSCLQSLCPLVPTLWIILPVYLILVLVQDDANFRYGERNVKEHLRHTFVTAHSWLTCKTHVFVLVQPLIWVGKGSAPKNSSWNTHSQKRHWAVNGGSSRPCQMSQITGADRCLYWCPACRMCLGVCGAAGRKPV